jgi:signal transduction histidine kinase/CheY-like chemotaxis protein
MEEVKYHQRFHQANMSHLLSVFNKSKNIMLIMVLSKLVFDKNIYAAIGIFMGYMIMVGWTHTIEKSNISNNKSVLVMAHFITIIKVVTCITATIRKNDTAPSGLQIGVVIWLILTMEAMKAIEPDYIKATKMFCIYWSFFLLSLCVYYGELMLEQFCMFGCLFWLIYEIYKEKYELSNSLTEIFYDFHNDPIVIYEDEKWIKCNNVFLGNFGKLVKYEKFDHHSQMLTTITNPDKVIFEFYQDEIVKTISLIEVIRKQKEMDQKELILRNETGDKIYMFTFNRLENIYNNKTVWIFKDTTHIHQLQKVNSQNEFRSVIMGWLTHELRTPVNCVISILKSMSDYIEDTDEARKLLLIWQGAIEMLRSLTEDFIDFTRFENEKGLPINKQNIKIVEFFTEIENIFAFQADEKGLGFGINYTHEVPETIYTDPKRLKQIIINLLSNSFKFTQIGKIEINLQVTQSSISDPDENFLDGSLNIEVIDTGIGIEENERAELFSKFGTGKNLRGLNTNGLGLGLYLSKEICQKLSGDITCESIPGIGSVFMVKIPFDSKHEIRHVLSKLKVIENGSSPRKNQLDFEEFKDWDTKDNFADNVDRHFEMGIKFTGFWKFDTTIDIRIFSDSKSVSLWSSDKNILEGVKPARKSVETRVLSKLELDIVKTCNWIKVLVVDDLAFNLLAVELMLKKKFDLAIDKAFGGEDSIKKVKQKLLSDWWQSYKLIIMDYYMPPGINGSEASIIIRQVLDQNNQSSYIACLTSQREGDFALDKSKKNFDQFFSKPFEAEDVKELIKNLFETM